MRRCLWEPGIEGSLWLELRPWWRKQYEKQPPWRKLSGIFLPGFLFHMCSCVRVCVCVCMFECVKHMWWRAEDNVWNRPPLLFYPTLWDRTLNQTQSSLMSSYQPACSRVPLSPLSMAGIPGRLLTWRFWKCKLCSCFSC